ncbi:D-alanine--D-alanine ligase [Candidatus Nomurabacteria bacterium]|nr:D-alanine--D-alanine ligase [Candidatus Nomurabacteria bacterium]
MSRIRVAVLRGGPSAEYDVSLETGASVLKHLPEGYEGHDILIDKKGVWHYRGLPIGAQEISRYADVIWNAMHGEYGEDGQVQNVLDKTGVPYTGSKSFASALAMNKSTAKESFRRAGLKVPAGQLFDLEREPAEAAATKVFQTISPPWVVKPADRGSSVGLYIAKNFTELSHAIAECFRFSGKVIVEEYIRGKEATVGVVDNFRNQKHYALPAIEIRRPAGKSVWTYDDKYNGATEEVCPGCFTNEEKKKLEELAILAHQSLGLEHYSRSDFILHPTRGIYLLETNSLPGLTSESLLPKSLAAVGCTYPEFLNHVIKLALAR